MTTNAANQAAESRGTTSEQLALEWITDHWSRDQLGDPTGIMAVASVLRLRELIMQSLEETVAPLGLTSTDFLVLLTVMLGEDGRRPLGRIARAMMVHPTTVTQAVDRLEEQKLVERVPHPTDRRAKLASLTRRGKAQCREVIKTWRVEGFGMPGIDEKQLGALVDLLTPLRTAANERHARSRSRRIS